MGERRSKRKTRIAEEEKERLGDLVVEGGRRESQSQRAGEAIRSGDRALAAVLEGALRHRGRAERATHGFHTYPAGLNPDAARDLLTLGSGPVLDPFCGGGTVLVEALLAGRDALGLDVSPIAGLVSRARTVRTTEEERTALRAGARKATESAIRVTAPPSGTSAELLRWYEPHVIGELYALRESIGKDPLLRAVFSSMLIKVSRRESDTSSARGNARRPQSTTAVLFHKKAREYARMLEELEQLAPPNVRARAHRDDARELRERDAFGLVVSSPPYPGVYDYVAMQYLRLGWLGMDPGSPTAEIGSRRQFRADREHALASWKADTRRWVKQAARALVTGGRLVVVIGDGQVGGRRVDTFAAMDEAAKLVGLTRLARTTVERWDEGVNAMRPEHAMLWEKPSTLGPAVDSSIRGSAADNAEGEEPAETSGVADWATDAHAEDPDAYMSEPEEDTSDDTEE